MKRPGKWGELLFLYAAGVAIKTKIDLSIELTAGIRHNNIIFVSWVITLNLVILASGGRAAFCRFA